MYTAIKTVLFVAFTVTIYPGHVSAEVNVFTEDFTESNANWANFNTSALLTHVPSGGPDGDAYASGPRVFQGLTAGNLTVIHRARHEDPFNASGDAFHRDWNADGIRRLSAYVRHNVPEPLTYFVRAAGPGGFPGATFDATGTVPSGVWTHVLFDVSAGSPQLLSTEDATWAAIFSDVGHLQFGVFVPAGHDSDPTAYTFDIDKVTIATPEPASLASAAAAAFCVLMFATRRSTWNSRP